MAKVLLSNAAKKAFGNAGGAASPHPQTIMQHAAAGHPNWFPGSNTHSNGGVGAAGSALLGPGASRPGAGATAPTAPATPAGPVAPFWTPAQSAAWQQYNIKYNQQIRDLNQHLTDAQGAHDRGIVEAQHTEAVNQNLANQAAAARGVFQSGIRQTMLSDIDTAYTMTKTTLDTTLSSIQLTTNGQITDLGTDYGVAQTEYNQEGVSNAQGVTPTVAPPAAPATTPPPATAPNASGSTPTLSNAGTALLGAGVLSGGNNGGGNLASGLNKIGGAVASGAANLEKIKPPGASGGSSASGTYGPPR